MIYLQLCYRYLKYFFRAKTKYDIHSPFVYEFIQEVLEDKRNFYAFSIIESLRDFLKKDDRMVPIIDFGAGSKVAPNQQQRQVSSLVRYSAVGPYSGKVLFHTAHLYKPKTILELGTSLGISTLYLAYAALKSEVISIEGNPVVALIAQENFDRFQLKNIESSVGQFEEVLEDKLSQLKGLDLFFVDGNHTKKATLDYFKQGLAYAHSNSVFIFGDIHWSKEMEEAWKAIKAHPRVTLSIDLFYLGLVFFRAEQKAPEHFTLIPARYKPWRMGFSLNFISLLPYRAGTQSFSC